MIKIQQPPKQTFLKYLAVNAIFWGIPLVIFELIGVPRDAWSSILLFELPVITVALFAVTVIEYGFLRWLAQRTSERQEPPSSG